MPELDEQLAPWNGFAAIVFIVLLIIFYLFLGWRGIELLYRLSALDVAIIALAAFRITHLLTYDKILNVVRDYFFDTRDGRLHKPKPGFRRMVCELLECIWCTSLWSALIAVALYLIGPFGRFVVIILAIAGAASLLQVISKRITE